jgi:hypothetical protein
MFALFECPFCEKEIETRKTIGLKQVCCKKCYSKYRKGKRYGGIKEKVKISGYWYIMKPRHPKAMKKGYVAEHRLMGEQIIGRYLLDDEVVHHKNDIKTDNRFENLQVMTISEHMSFHSNNKKRGLNGKFEI